MRTSWSGSASVADPGKLDVRAPCLALAIVFALKSALAYARGAVSSSQFCRLLRFGRVSHLSFKVTPTASPAAGPSVRQASSLGLKPSSFHPHGGVCFSWWEKHRGDGLRSVQPWERLSLGRRCPSSCVQTGGQGLPPEGPAHPLWLCSGFEVSERLPSPHRGASRVGLPCPRPSCARCAALLGCG